MKIIEKRSFEGERPLYKSNDIIIKDCEFLPGESAIKESRNVKAENCVFKDKYPFWHNKNVEIYDSYFSEDSRAAIWYTSDLLMDNCKVDAPKIFRDAENITITNTKMDTEETLWDCNNVKITDSEFKGNYLLLHGSNIELTNFKLDGNYSFQHVKNGIVKNCIIKSKDTFWNTENITVYDSVLDGEYLGWYAKNLKLINCTIMGTQPLCYAENLVMENCKMINTDRSFEYTSVQAEVTTVIESVKNPLSGVINAKGIEDIILDDEKLDHSKTKIIIKG